MQLPPIHPALVHFPIAMIVVAFFGDLIARAKRKDSIRHLGWWCLLIALGTGVLTLLTGYFDMTRARLESPAHDFVHVHMYSGFTLAGLLIILTFWRWRIRRRESGFVPVSFLCAGLVLLGVTLFQGWYGSEMVYSQGVGVAATGQSPESRDKAQQRLVAVSEFLTGKDFGESAVGAPPPSKTGRETGVRHEQHDRAGGHGHPH